MFGLLQLFTSVMCLFGFIRGESIHVNIVCFLEALCNISQLFITYLLGGILGISVSFFYFMNLIQIQPCQT